MNLELQIAKRILFSSESSGMARPVIRVALVSIALGLAVMLISVLVVNGFRDEITNKVAGFGSHIQVGNFSSNESYESEPIDKDSVTQYHLNKNPYIKNIHAFATKPGIIKTKTDIQGIVLKGVGSDYNWKFFKDKLVSGATFSVVDSQKTNDVIISKNIADKLKLKSGDKMLVYFFQQPPLIRSFHISGIYSTGLEEFDVLFMFCDIAHIQKLNDWQINQVGGFEIETNDISKIDEATESIYNALGFRYTARNIKEIYPQIFNWLELVDANVVIIIRLLLAVTCINMISTLLIIILDNTSDIGVLKALGATNFSIRKVFFYVSLYLVVAGIFFGNIFGLGIALIQYHFHLIKIPQDTYYISYVPVAFSWLNILMLNGVTILLCVVVLLVPATIVSRIQPVKAIRFE